MQEEKKRNEDALAKIKDYVDHIDKEQKKVAKKPKRMFIRLFYFTYSKQNEVVLATIIENVPARYTKPELGRAFQDYSMQSDSFLVLDQQIPLHCILLCLVIIGRGEIDSVFVPPNMQTRSITIQYQTQKGSKRCKELVRVDY